MTKKSRQHPLALGFGPPEQFLENLKANPQFYDLVLVEVCRLWSENRVRMSDMELDMLCTRFSELIGHLRTMGKPVSAKAEAKEKVKVLVEVLGLPPEVARRKVAESMGMKQDTVARYDREREE
jgi:hypothetical protein